jgi:hypothetical protein
MISRQPRTVLEVFAIPLLLALVSVGGLVAGLLGDGIWDMLSWLALGVLLATVGWHVTRSICG